MSETDPKFIDPTPPEADIKHAHNGSTVEVYNFQDILGTPQACIYDDDDFDGKIDRVVVESLVGMIGSTEISQGLSLTVSLGNTGKLSSPRVLDYLNARLKFQGPHVTSADTSFAYCKYVTTADGLNLLAWYDEDNGNIVLSNYAHLALVDDDEKSVRVIPAPLRTVDPREQFKSFSTVMIDVIDILSQHKLNRRYSLGEGFVDTLRTPQSMGRMAVQGSLKPPTTDPTPHNPLDQFRDIVLEVDEKIKLDDVGGLEDAKEELKNIALSFSNPEIMDKWGARRPQGILLYGPPGTGKTMLAEALANEIEADLLAIQSSDIYVKWLGESEERIKQLFAAFKELEKPTVVLFDEFDAIVGITGKPSSGGADNARNSVAGIFKQEMNSLAKENPHVLVVATTNHHDKIDESLIRAGRFDHRIYVPKPDEAARSQIISNVIYRLMRGQESTGFTMFNDTLDVPKLADLSDGLSGADIAEVFRRIGLAKAMQEARFGHAEPISQADMMKVIKEFKTELT